MWRRAFALFALGLNVSTAGCHRDGMALGCGACPAICADTVTEGPLPGEPELRYVATGYACRVQLSRSGHGRVRHPAQILLEVLRRRG